MKLLMLVCCLGYSMAWWCKGHMLTAMVAQLDLQIDSKASFEQAQGVVGFLGGDLTHGNSNMFVESACWADDIKGYGFKATNGWHYIEKQYIEDSSVMPNGKEAKENVVWAINEAVSTLKNRNSANAKLETALMLRFLIHFVGDLHQPLHAASLYNEKHPNGDRGGNSFVIKFNKHIRNLHSLWDAALGELEQDLARPLSNSNYAEFEEYARDLMREYPREELAKELSEGNYANWAEESYNLAQNFVYQSIQEHQRPSDQYIEDGIELVRRRIALAGYRLADLLREIYPSSECE